MKEGTRVEISRNSTVLQNPNHLYCELGEEAVLLNLGDGVYYGLDPVGARIWALLCEAKPVHVLCEILLGEFDVESDRCETEVLALLQELADCRLVKVG